MDRPQAGGCTIYEPALAAENSIRTPNPFDVPFFGNDNARPR